MCVCVSRSAYLEVCELGVCVCVCVSSCVWLRVYVSQLCVCRPGCVYSSVCLQPGVLVCVLAQGVWILVGVAAGGNTFLSSEAAGRPGWDHRSQPLPLAAEDKGQKEVLWRF